MSLRRLARQEFGVSKEVVWYRDDVFLSRSDNFGVFASGPRVRDRPLVFQHGLSVSDRHSKIGTAKIFHNSKCHTDHASFAVN
jgi:hypothetical protein